MELLRSLELRKTEAKGKAQCFQDLLNGKAAEQCFDRLDQAAMIADHDDLVAKFNHWTNVAHGLELDISWVQGAKFGCCQDHRVDTCTGSIEEEKLRLSPAAKQCIKCTLAERQGKAKEKIN